MVILHQTNMSFLNIERENRPAIYELSVGLNNQSLIVSIHQDVYSEVQKMLQSVGLRPWFLSEDLNLPQFLSPSKSWLWWGFGPVADNLPAPKGSFVPIEVILPRIVKYPPGYELAKTLDLPKVPWEEGYDCTLWQPDFDWNFAHAVSATLTLLFKSLSTVEIPMDSEKPQLVEVDMSTNLNNNPISVTLGRSILPYLNRQFNNSHSQKAENVIREAYQYMMGKDEFSMNRFRVLYREHRWVNLIVPGDACGLNPDGYYNTDKEGYTIYPHNVDSVAQQLTLLMGIAAIHQEAREMGF